MRLIFSFLLFFAFNTYGQSSKITHGKIIDYAHNQPFAFVNVTHINDSTTLTDFDGYFNFQEIELKINDLKFDFYHYKKNPLKSYIKQDTLIIILVQDSLFKEVKIEFAHPPVDTVNYKNGKIKRILFPSEDILLYHKNGRIKEKSVEGIQRIWYRNGNLKFQSVYHSRHNWIISKYYKNGNLKAYGGKTWFYFKRKNEGRYIKDDDWKYFKRDGNMKKRLR